MEWKSTENTDLVNAVLSLRDAAEVRLFLRDLMTESEIEEFAKRFKAARMLTDKVPYSHIQKETGLSATTVARVSKWLQGAGGGYRLILDRLHPHTKTSRAKGAS